MIAVLLDSVSSNHKRLLAEVKAGYAYASLRYRAKSFYNGKAGPLLNKQPGDRELDPATHAEILRLQQELHSILADGIASVKAKLVEADIAALEALSLDNERAAAKP